jgi:hypothetical protein
VVDDQRDPRVLRDVPTPTEVLRPHALRFLVYRGHDAVAGDGEADGHGVRASLRVGRGQTADARRLDVLALSVLEHVRPDAGRTEEPFAGGDSGVDSVTLAADFLETNRVKPP